MITELKTIPTKDEAGNPSGIVVPIWHVDDGRKVDQVYMTTILPKCQKGPHLHKKRCGAFTVIHGDVLIVTKHGDEYREFRSGDGFRTVHVEPGVTAALYNVGTTEALILNMPTPPWRADDQDEWPVEGWTYQVTR
jgi:mannose-6-phosphate isomerase-like protein (cupin superfamily)